MSTPDKSASFEEQAAVYAVEASNVRERFSREDYVRAGGPYADLVQDLVESGEFDNPAEVLLEGLALVEEQHLLRRALDEKIRLAVQVGFDAADRGDTVPVEDVMAELRVRYAKKSSR